jgi:excisionase family DNA binding protein
MNTAIKINEKTINVAGRDTLVKLIVMGEEEGLTTKQAADLLGVTVNGIQKAIADHNLSFTTVSGTPLLLLKRQGVVGRAAPKVKFMNRETIRQLVKILNTPEAQAVYDQLWELADTVYEAHVNNTTVDLMDPDFIIALATELKKKNALLAETKLQLAETTQAKELYRTIVIQLDDIVKEREAVIDQHEERWDSVKEHGHRIGVRAYLHSKNCFEAAKSKLMCFRVTNGAKRLCIEAGLPIVTSKTKDGLDYYIFPENVLYQACAEIAKTPEGYKCRFHLKFKEETL